MIPKILLVDDEAAINNLIKLHFQTEGYLVYTASDAEEATQMLSHAPDLILLDINMPEVDGLEFCKKVRNHIDCHYLPNLPRYGAGQNHWPAGRWGRLHHKAV